MMSRFFLELLLFVREVPGTQSTSLQNIAFYITDARSGRIYSVCCADEEKQQVLR